MATDNQGSVENIEPEISDEIQETADEAVAESVSAEEPASENAEEGDEKPASTEKAKKKKKKKGANAEPANLDEKAGENAYSFNAKQAKRKHARFEQGALFVNKCTFTKDVYREYLRGAQPKYKTPIIAICTVIFVMILAVAVNYGMDLPMLSTSLLGLVGCGFVYGQPWILANMKTTRTEIQYGGPQRNVTYFYDDGLLMNNISADAQAYCYYTDIRKLKETDDFIYMFVNKSSYIAILTGFKGGEAEIPAFRKFITEKAVNATGGVAEEKPEKEKKSKKSKIKDTGDDEDIFAE